MKHIGQAKILLTHQIAHGTVFLAEVQGTGGLSATTHLVEQACKRDVIALAQRAVLVYQELGYDKQGDSLDAFWRSLYPRQYQVNDVLVQFMVTARYPDLVAGNAVGTVGGGNRIGCQIRQAGPRTGLTHGHSAGETPGQHWLQPLRLLLRRAVGIDQVGIGVGQGDITHGGAGCRAKVGAGSGGHYARQLHATQFIIRTGIGQARVDHCIEGHLDLGDHLDFLAIKCGLISVDLLPVGQEVFLGHGTGSVDGRVKGFPIVVGVALTAGQAFGVE